MEEIKTLSDLQEKLDELLAENEALQKLLDKYEDALRKIFFVVKETEIE